MNGVHPIVRYLVVCDDVTRSPVTNRETLVGLISTIDSRRDPPFPVTHPALCVYVQLTECRGNGAVRVRIAQDDTDTEVYATPVRTVSMGTDPLAIRSLVFRVLNCSYPAAGLYWVQFWYNGQILAQQPLVLR